VKVLHVIDIIDAKAGGAMRAVLDTCRALNGEGISCTGIATAGAQDDLSHLAGEYADVETKTFPRSFPTRYSNSNELIRWLKIHGKEFDLVEIHCIFSVIAWRAAWHCAKNGIPYLIRPHSSLDPHDLKKHNSLKKIVGPLLIKGMLEKSSGVVLTAPLEAERMNSYGGSVRKIVIPLPVHLSKEGGDGAAFRLRKHIPADATVILFLSRIDPKKGLQFLIPALEKVKIAFPDLWFVLAGSGEKNYAEEVFGMLDDFRVRSFTTITGFLSGGEKRDAFAGADLFALPSLNENFGIVNIEAMNAGVPLLISREVYIYPEVQRASAGKVCDPTIGSVEKTLLEMLSTTSLLEQMGKNAKMLVEDQYRPEIAIQSLIGCYQQVINQ